MIGSNGPNIVDNWQPIIELIDENTRAGLAVLWRAYCLAKDAGADVWDFSMPIGELYEARMTISDLRWLVAKGFAEHGLETTVCGGPHRSFLPSHGFYFEHATCVILTSSGAAFANHVLNTSVASPKSPQRVAPGLLAGGEIAAPDTARPVVNNTRGSTGDALKPRWDSTRRELFLRDMLVKRFRVPAHNQALILSVFEEEGWPEHIDDPLPHRRHIDAHARLHDAINRLNSSQIHPLLRFHGNGNGTGVTWELCQSGALREIVNSANPRKRKKELASS